MKILRYGSIKWNGPEHIEVSGWNIDFEGEVVASTQTAVIEILIDLLRKANVSIAN